MIKVFISKVKEEKIKCIYIKEDEKESFIKEADEKGYTIKERTASDGQVILNLTQNDTMSLKEAIKLL